MIKTETISANAVKITAPEKLQAEDFSAIAPQIDALISEHGKIRLLIDATGLNGWANIAAFEKHLAFVKAHQQKVERVAVITGHEWHHWLIGVAKLFMHPEIKAFDKPRENEARQWLVG